MNEKREGIKHYSRYIVIALAVVFVVAAALLLLKLWEINQGSFPEANVEETKFVYNDTEYELKENVDTFLVMGLDKFEGSVNNDSYNNDQQADFLMLLVFDNNSKKYSAIQINRDTLTDVNILGVAGQKVDTVKKQIALAHTYGNGEEVSCRNTADAVSKLLLDMKVDHYISFTMDSVAVYADLLGGVEVEVLDDFNGIDDTLVKGQTVTLKGEHALNYVRSRQGLDDSTNQTRMKRQRQFIYAAQEKSNQLMNTDDEFVFNASAKMADYIVSDRSVTQLQALAEKINSYEFAGIKSFEGEMQQGDEFMEFHPDENSIKEIVVDLFYKPKG